MPDLPPPPIEGSPDVPHDADELEVRPDTEPAADALEAEAVETGPSEPVTVAAETDADDLEKERLHWAAEASTYLPEDQETNED